MSNEKNNQDIFSTKESKRITHQQKEITTEMSENTYEPGYTLKSSNQALDSQNNLHKNYISSSNSIEAEFIEKKNFAEEKNEEVYNQADKQKTIRSAFNPNEENNDENYDNSNDEPIYIMTLELERGKSEKLKIFAESDPYELAVEFCRTNNLDQDAVKYLAGEIEKLINKNKFINGEENNINSENLDNTEEEYIDNYNPYEDNFNGNLQYDYGNNKNSSRSNNNSGKKFKYSNLDDIDYNTDEYENNENNIRFLTNKNSENSKRNSKENFYLNQDYESNENLTHRKNYLNENLPYLVHEQITEVDEENNITIEKLKSSKTENENSKNSRSPLDRDNEINEISEENQEKIEIDNSHLINKVIKDQDNINDYKFKLTSSNEFQETYPGNKIIDSDIKNSPKILENENENLIKSKENNVSKEAINNLNCHSNYNYFQKNLVENNMQISISDKKNYNQNDNMNSDAQIYFRDNVLNENNNFNKSLKNKENTVTPFVNPIDYENHFYANENREEKFFTFKMANDSNKDENKSLQNSKNSKTFNTNKEIFSNSLGKNISTPDNLIDNDSNYKRYDYNNECPIGNNLINVYNEKLASDFNKTIKKKNLHEVITDKDMHLNSNPIYQYDQQLYGIGNNSENKGNQFRINDLKNNGNNKNKSSEKLYYIADTNDYENPYKENKIIYTDKDIKSANLHNNYNKVSVQEIQKKDFDGNSKVNVKDYQNPQLENNTYVNSKENKNIYSNNNKYISQKEKTSELSNKSKNLGKDSQSSFALKKQNSRSKYQSLAERTNKNNSIQDSTSNNCRFNSNMNINPSYNLVYNIHSNINNKIVNYQDKMNMDKNYDNDFEINQVSNNLESQRIYNYTNSKNELEKVNINNQKGNNHVMKEAIVSNAKIYNPTGNQINNFINSIENEITSIKGTQSSNNEKYDKDHKDKSDFNNLNNLNNLIKVASENKNDESDTIINNNINTINTQNNIQITKSSNSNINYLVENNNNNNLEFKTNLNNRNRDNQIYGNFYNRNQIYQKENLNEDNINRLEIQSPQKKVYFPEDINYKNSKENEILEASENQIKNPTNSPKNNDMNQQLPKTYSNVSLEENKLNEINKRKSSKQRRRYTPSKIYTKDRIVSIQDHQCFHKKIDLKGLNIFDRLYKEAEIKRIIPKKIIKEEENEYYSRNNKINLDPNINFGEILYTREKLSKEEKERKLMQIKYEQDIQQMKNLTFTPEIHEYNVYFI